MSLAEAEPIKCGIYRIVNTITNRTYIGSGKNIARRFYLHRWNLNKGSHTNVHLQQSWNKHGESAFVFEGLKKCALDELTTHEQKFLDAYLNHDMPVYNKIKDVKAIYFGRIPSQAWRNEHRLAMLGDRNGFRGKRHSPESIEKQRVAKRGKILTAEHRAHISAATAGVNHPLFGTKMPDETKKKISDAHVGKTLSEDTKKKISESLIGNSRARGSSHTAEARAAAGRRHLGIPKSLEQRRKMSDSAKLRWQHSKTLQEVGV